ncbi:uncharacterized protein LOC115211991 isoform X2 [Octopus sinensis]|nr:uncharacterized protein LOC115211991 isoform X2 [Octopus sinensis]XP_036358981.1 uncharacterized protein LOC115211991 isoform X2 [Octopus sinensis]XP_036358982.1 uncharacterized protein LOC115211991 isoform X2 [Octopus sinensis]
MDIKFFCLLVILYSTSGSNSFKIIQNETAWLGESLVLQTEEIPNLKRPAVWKYNNYKYECDRTCATGAYTVTQDGNISTLTIKNVSWEFSKWSFNDDDLRVAHLKLDIKVKPTIEIMNETDCKYNVTAKCSLPVTRIECYLGKALQPFISNKTETCPDGKTYTSSATLEPPSGNLKCSFTIDSIFSAERTTEVNCNIPSATTSDFYTSVYIESSSINDNVNTTEINDNVNTTKSFVGRLSQSTILQSTPTTTKESSADGKTKQINCISIIIAVLIIIGVVDT